MRELPHHHSKKAITNTGGVPSHTRPHTLAQNRRGLCSPTPPMDKWRLVAGNPLPCLLSCAARSVGLVPFEIPDPRHIVDPQVADQPVTQATGTHASDVQYVLILITQDVDADDWRDAVQVTGIPALRTLRLFHPRDHIKRISPATEYCGCREPRSQRVGPCDRRLVSQDMGSVKKKIPYVEIIIPRLTISCGKALIRRWSIGEPTRNVLWIAQIGAGERMLT